MTLSALDDLSATPRGTGFRLPVAGMDDLEAVRQLIRAKVSR